ncbi:DUF368 domain-containing protein [Sediminivirga luteola]|uniref:DUF368 domain-containing protein n=1 Tax=Sediminivirga luteola TaxID=1774748 RepID=A0A8J2TXY7_9MICO|nr:DUF368 domain-containing protein [Sediminivirga luteola]MCI2266686.1 DUF368 domain-containing protein [Sediminivirga luteola]GGA13146.1 DUF368 domain-containing protein [Sediminivirga luteola]
MITPPLQQTPHPSRKPPVTPLSVTGNLGRGFVIGSVESMPGVSGGTAALVVGIYERLIGSAGSFVSGIVRVVLGGSAPGRTRKDGRARLKQVEWGMLIPLAVGMLLGLLTLARVMETAIEEYPVLTRAAFFGMVLVTLYIPFTLAGRWRVRDVIYALAAAAVAYVAVSLPPQSLEPSPPVIAVSAAVAVCALLIPGVSGSFLLLSIGMYQPALQALNDRDFAFIGWFILGAVAGGATMLRLLEWLLEHRHHMVMVLATGVMAGALRALWPWQDEHRTLQAPAADAPVALLFFLAGAAIVVGTIVLEYRLSRSRRS